MDVPLPWEHLLWRHQPWWRRDVHCALTDFRIVCGKGAESRELALQDIADVQRLRHSIDHLLGTSTIVLRSRHQHVLPLTIPAVRRGAQLAALIELLAGDPTARPDEETVRAMLSWTPRLGRRPIEVIAGVGVVALALSSVVIGLHGEAPGISYPADDAVYPGGAKRDRDAIVDFMETEVLPWAQTTLGPLKGGARKVNCETCHGPEPDARNWRMPSVAALPEPQVGHYASEALVGVVDAQMRNAMYGYLAESDKQTKAAYMRQVVVPGMARLLGRPPYDFTKTYQYNRTRFAFGCYHCHMVTDSVRD